MPFWSKKKNKDPVCGMEVEIGNAAATHEYLGETYYFCSTTCKDNFAKSPIEYLK